VYDSTAPEPPRYISDYFFYTNSIHMIFNTNIKQPLLFIIIHVKPTSMLQIGILALFASLSTASLLGHDVPKSCKKDPNSMQCEFDYLDSVCQPDWMSGEDWTANAPCNVQGYLFYACQYGQQLHANKTGVKIPNGPMQSNNTQRLCICESQYFEAVEGCMDCYKAHGASEGFGFALPHSLISSMSSTYCAATATPTLGLSDFQLSFMEKPQFKSLFSSNTAKATSTFSDPLGNKTDVSLYYTGAATGSAALDIGKFTGTASPTTTAIEKGQIVETASTKAPTTAMATAKGTVTQVATGRHSTTPGTSTTSTGGSGAQQTQAALAGVLGLVGVVAML
jgi:hypothetical protein